MKILQKAVRGRIRKVIGGGVIPQAFHNAQVVGVTDTELDRGRRMVGEMVNVKKRHSTTASLFTMPGYVDPIFKGTIPLVKNWLQILWGSELPIKQVYQVWRHYQSQPKGIGGGELVSSLGLPWV